MFVIVFDQRVAGAAQLIGLIENLQAGVAVFPAAGLVAQQRFNGLGKLCKQRFYPIDDLDTLRVLQGVDGAIFQMLSHGFISAALFLCVGVIYDRMHTREIDAYGGLVIRMPAYALVFMFFTMGNVGLPGTSGFVGEFLTLMGAFKANTWVAAIATSGVILSAAYALWLYRRVVMGDLIKESLKTIKDMTAREKWIFAPLVAMTLLLGVYPALVTDIIGPSVEALINNYDTALAQSPTATQVATAH